MLAVYTLVVDRLQHTQKVIEDLENNNNTEFVHFIMSQGSNEETNRWLSYHKFKHSTYIYRWDENRGISEGSNFLVGEIAKRLPEYHFDLVAKIDNDYTEATPNWLDRCVKVARNFNILCSPLVLGLNTFPNGVPGYSTQEMAGEKVRLTHHIGGVVHLAKADLHLGYRYSPDLTMAVDQDISFTTWARRTQYYLIGYLEDAKISHRTTEQEKECPEYFDKKKIWETTLYKPMKSA